MRIDGIDLLEGSKVANLTVDSGDATAQAALTPTAGELFFRTDLNTLNVYHNATWESPLLQGQDATVSGFTSTGIDDNATSTQLTISDTSAVFAGNQTIAGTLAVTGTSFLTSAVLTGNLFLDDTKRLYLGNGNDLAWQHNGTHSYLENQTGNVIFREVVNSGLFNFDTFNSVGVEKRSLSLGGATPNVALYYDGALKAYTTNAGFTAQGLTVGTIFAKGLNGYGSFYAQGSGVNPAYLFMGNTTTGERARLTALDNGALLLGTNGATTALTLDVSQNATFAGNVTMAKSLFLSSTTPLLYATSGTFSIVNYGVSQLIRLATDNSAGVQKFGIEVGGATPAVKLYYGGTEKFKTLSGGVQITGDITHASTTTTTSAIAGAATALPTLPAGYITQTINGTLRKIPYYSV